MKSHTAILLIGILFSVTVSCSWPKIVVASPKARGWTLGVWQSVEEVDPAYFDSRSGMIRDAERFYRDYCESSKLGFRAVVSKGHAWLFQDDTLGGVLRYEDPGDLDLRFGDQYRIAILICRDRSATLQVRNGRVSWSQQIFGTADPATFVSKGVRYRIRSVDLLMPDLSMILLLTTDSAIEEAKVWHLVETELWPRFSPKVLRVDVRQQAFYRRGVGPIGDPMATNWPHRTEQELAAEASVSCELSEKVGRLHCRPYNLTTGAGQRRAKANP